MRTTSLSDAVAMIPGGSSMMIGGFMGVGTPEPIIDELVRQQKCDLTVIANDTSFPEVGIPFLALQETMSKHIVAGLEAWREMTEAASGVSVDDVIKATEAELVVSPQLTGTQPA